MKKKGKTKGRKEMKLGMTSIPLRHVLLGATLWGNTAIGKTCLLC